MEAKINRTYELRLAATAHLLGKDVEETKIDEDTGEVVTIKKKPAGKPISREDAQILEYKALVSEGAALFRAREYRRAIEAYSQAMERQKDEQSILIDRANCYIQVGQPEDAIRDVDRVLQHQSTNPRAILTKAEAYFSMGEFEFALVFFQRGVSVRRDIAAFKDGVTKCRSAILDSINGVELFQANPNYANSRKQLRKPLARVRGDTRAPPPEDPEALQRTAALLPEKVEPLSTAQQKKQFLAELSLDYDYLLELKQEEKDAMADDAFGKEEDEQILAVVNDALGYLDQRGAFWAQQDGGKNKADEERDGESTEQQQQRKTEKAQRAQYEMTKIEQYERKYGDKKQSPND
jgi:thioredoxin-like negative regulator of GroEL